MTLWVNHGGLHYSWLRATWDRGHRRKLTHAARANRHTATTYRDGLISKSIDESLTEGTLGSRHRLPSHFSTFSHSKSPEKDGKDIKIRGGGPVIRQCTCYATISSQIRPSFPCQRWKIIFPSALLWCNIKHLICIRTAKLDLARHGRYGYRSHKKCCIVGCEEQQRTSWTCFVKPIDLLTRNISAITHTGQLQYHQLTWPQVFGLWEDNMHFRKAPESP